jgi:arylsulfatase A-like enzyme
MLQSSAMSNTQKTSWFLYFLLQTCAGRVASINAEPPSTPPNIVLIISDDHAWTDYGFMGHKQLHTPNLDRLAEQSLVFSRGYVPSSLCCPSLASIITGLYPHQHMVTSNDPPLPPGTPRKGFYETDAYKNGRETMNRHLEAVPTLPHLLAAAGYESLQTGKWWQGNFSRGGFTHGMTRGERHGDDGIDIGRKTMQSIYDFVADARKNQHPFFVWYAPMLPHLPHNAPERLLAKYKGVAPSEPDAKYWATVEWFDETVGDLLHYLDEHQLADNTIVVYLADNGFVPDPKTGQADDRSKQSPYDGGLRTPIMIRWPGHVKPGRSDSLATSLDLAPTLLAAANLKPAPQMPGINLLDENAVESRKAIFGECFTHNSKDLDHPAASLRWRWMIQDEWKLILPDATNERNAPVELFSILEDPTEQNNEAGSNADKVDAMTEKINAWWPATK